MTPNAIFLTQLLYHYIRYHILDLLGQGTFGQVVKCMNIKTRELVAVKVIKNKPAYYNQSLVEVAILDILNNKWDQSDKYHIVGMKDTFLFRNHLCIVFEMLSANLYELIKQNQFRGLSISLVRVFVKQILECLVLLSRAKIIHSDLKPENILLKTLTEPEIKVIDFGSACHENQTIYTYIQSRFYRSPEVLVGLPYTSSIDMWSLGCIAAELFLGLPLFPGTSEYNQVSRIVGVLGMPQQWMCEKGKTSKNFFAKKAEGGYELKSMEAYTLDTGLVEQPSKRYFAGNTLEEIINVYPMPKKEMSSSETEKEISHRKCLLDFLGGLLKLNPLERWSPQQAKMHPFVTGEAFLAPFATSATFRLPPNVFPWTSPTAPSVPIGLPFPPDIAPTKNHGGGSPESVSSSSTTHAATVSANSNAGAGSNSGAATRRPRANTMIQAVPPQLQKIVTMQQQSGPNKSSLRNAAAGGGGANIIIPGNAKAAGAVVAVSSNSSLNNDDVVYPSPDMKPVATESTSIPHTQLDEDNTPGATGRARSFSISQHPGASYDPHYQRHYPLRKAVSETLNSPLQPPSQFHQTQNLHHQQHNMPPLPNQAHLQHHQHQHHGSMPITESLNSLQLSSHGGVQQQQIPYYEGSHAPYEVQSNLNPGALVDPAQMGFQQHPRMGEKSERKPGLASRAPSLPGLVELDPTGNSVDPAVVAAAAALAHAARTNSNPDLGPNAYDMNQRRMSLTIDGYGNASPRFRTQHGFAFPNQNAYASSPRSSFPSSPRNSYQQPQQPQHSPYSQQPVPPVYSSSPYQYPAQSGLGVYDPSGSSYGNETLSQHAGPGFRGRSVSLSMHGQYPLNQPWNQPLPPTQQHQQQQQTQQQQQHQPRSSKKRPPNISTTLGTSPQQFQQYNQQSAPTNVYPQYGSHSANSNGYHPSALSANDLNARNPDMIGIPPQRINHPVTLGMRRQSIQYGSTPPNYSSSYHNSPSGSGLVPGFGGSRGSSLNPGHAGGSGGGPSSAGIVSNGGNSMDFPKASINSQASSSLSTSALSRRTLRFQNAAPLGPSVVPLSAQEAPATAEEKEGSVSDEDVETFHRLLTIMASSATADPSRWVEDMTCLPELSEPSILDNIKKRFQDGLIYTYTGSILVAVNPYKNLDIFGYATIAKYENQERQKNSPHIFALSDAAISLIRTEKKNQSVIISGESGSGKSESTKYILSYLTAVTSHHSNTSWIHQQILEANTVLESFGNAKTSRNNNSSRFGKFIQVQLDKNLQIIGANITSYLLEKSRVARQAKSERNYHVFYELVQGANEDEIQDFFLQPAESFNYLSQSGCTSILGVDSRSKFEGLKFSLTVLNITGDQTNCIFKLLSAILWLGNVNFKAQAGNESVTIEDKSVIRNIATLLGVDEANLNKVLCFKKLVVRTETTMVPLKPIQATDNRDSIAKNLYSNLFRVLLELINATLQAGPDNDAQNSIGVLDIFGFEDFVINSFEQFCINYTNEKLQNFFNQFIFKLEQEEYEKEGINWEKISYEDNQPCIDLIEAKTTGILAQLDEEVKLPKGSEESWMIKLEKTHDKHKHFTKPKLKNNVFGIKHYAGDVLYTVDGFLEKNKDALQDELYDLISNSSYPFIASIIIPKDNDVFSGGSSPGTPRNEPVLSKGSPANSMQALNQPFINSNVPTPKMTPKTTSKMTAGGTFKNQLNSLVMTLGSTSTHYVRCIKPNSTMEAFTFDEPKVLCQLRYSGMMETIKIRKTGFPARVPFEKFNIENRFILPSDAKLSNDPKEKAKLIASVCNLPDVARGWQARKLHRKLKEEKAKALKAEEERKERELRELRALEAAEMERQATERMMSELRAAQVKLQEAQQKQQEEERKRQEEASEAEKVEQQTRIQREAAAMATLDTLIGKVEPEPEVRQSRTVNSDTDSLSPEPTPLAKKANADNKLDEIFSFIKDFNSHDELAALAQNLTSEINELYEKKKVLLSNDNLADVAPRIILTRALDPALKKHEEICTAMHQIVHMGLTNVNLRDEVFVQIIKQITVPLDGEPKGWNEITLNGWQLLTLCIGTFPPSKLFSKFLLAFDGVVNKLCKIYVMDGHSFDILISPVTTADEVVKEISKKFKLKDTASWSLYTVTQKESKAIRSVEYLADCMLVMQKESKKPTSTKKECPVTLDEDFKLTLKKRIFKNPKEDLRTKDETEIHLLCCQADHEVNTDFYPIGLREGVKLAALKAHIMLGDYNPNSAQLPHAANILQWITPRVISKASKENVAKMVIDEYAKLKGKPPVEAKLEYLNIVKALRFYGASLFEIESPGDLAFNEPIDIAISVTGVQLIQAVSREIAMVFAAEEIKDVQLDERTISIIIGKHSDSLTEVYEFTSNRSEEMASLIRDYCGIRVMAAKERVYSENDIANLKKGIEIARTNLIENECIRTPGPDSFAAEFIPSTTAPGSPKTIRGSLIMPKSLMSMKSVGSTSRSASPTSSRKKSGFGVFTKSDAPDDATADYSEADWIFSTTKLVASILAPQHEASDFAMNLNIFILEYIGLAKGVEIPNRLSKLTAPVAAYIQRIQRLFEQCLEKPVLSNELYLQIIKMTSKNADKVSYASTQMWKLMCVSVGVVTPTIPEIMEYLKAHLRRCEAVDLKDKSEKEQSKYANYALKTLYQTIRGGKRIYPPSTEEIGCAMKCSPMTIRFYALNRQFRALPIHSSDSIESIYCNLMDKFGIAEASGFAIYQYYAKSELALFAEDKISDVIFKCEKASFVSQTSDKVHFIIKKRLFDEPLKPSDHPAEEEFVRWQVVEDIKNDRYPLRQEDLITAAAFTAQIQFGDAALGAVERYYMEIRVPKSN
ncbi:UNVERIFIED_CONTAM: cytochrome c oxidase subunit 1 [Siphonaria sp. JEL0065]|nr:cytochrome c oxidase subunit 1 [Siphonaria sp. JEL0065]